MSRTETPFKYTFAASAVSLHRQMDGLVDTFQSEEFLYKIGVKQFVEQVWPILKERGYDFNIENKPFNLQDIAYELVADMIEALDCPHAKKKMAHHRDFYAYALQCGLAFKIMRQARENGDDVKIFYVDEDECDVQAIGDYRPLSFLLDKISPSAPQPRRHPE